MGLFMDWKLQTVMLTLDRFTPSSSAFKLWAGKWLLYNNNDNNNDDNNHNENIDRTDFTMNLI